MKPSRSKVCLTKRLLLTLALGSLTGIPAFAADPAPPSVATAPPAAAPPAAAPLATSVSSGPEAPTTPAFAGATGVLGAPERPALEPAGPTNPAAASAAMTVPPAAPAATPPVAQGINVPDAPSAPAESAALSAAGAAGEDDASGVFVYLPLKKGVTLRASLLPGKQDLISNLRHKLGDSKSVALSVRAASEQQTNFLSCLSSACDGLVIEDRRPSDMSLVVATIGEEASGVYDELRGHVSGSVPISVSRIYFTTERGSSDADGYFTQLTSDHVVSTASTKTPPDAQARTPASEVQPASVPPAAAPSAP